MIRSQAHGGTLLGAAIKRINGVPRDRLIVITDEQSADKVPDPKAAKAYMVNVASARNGVGYSDGSGGAGRTSTASPRRSWALCVSTSGS